MKQWAFKIPPTLGGGDFVLREVGVGESESNMDAAIGSAGADEGKLMRAGATAARMTKRAALVSWKGEVVGDGNAREAFFAKNVNSPKIARLYDKAYQAIHALKDDEEAYLLESMELVGNDVGAAA